MPYDRKAATAGGVRIAPLAFLALGLAVAVVLFTGRTPAPAEAAGETVESAIIAVTGEGSNARGWFEGASPPGIDLQKALDHFANKGFRVIDITFPHDAITTEGAIWYIILEKTN